MDTNIINILEINLAITGIFFSILFSSTEIALISANKLQIDVWIKQKYRFSKLTRLIIYNKSKFLTVALIGTNLSNILASSFFTVYFMKLTNYKYEGMLFIPIALIILIFGEILPKTIIREYSNIMLLILSPILWEYSEYMPGIKYVSWELNSIVDWSGRNVKTILEKLWS